MDEDEDILKQMLPKCKEILQQWDLFVNEVKTEFIHFHTAGKDEHDKKGDSLKDRQAVSLESWLYSRADIAHQCILGNTVFQKCLSDDAATLIRIEFGSKRSL